MCQCHGSENDVTTGAKSRGSASAPLVAYEMRRGSDEIQIQVRPATNLGELFRLAHERGEPSKESVDIQRESRLELHATT
jgi:hypothetical protein